MPPWLTEILDAEYAGLPWQMPAKLPSALQLRDAIDRCDLTLVGGVTPAFAKQCFAKMLAAFEPNTKLSGDETRLRMAVWLEACGDLNDALWTQATAEAIQTMKWMPKPAEFRALVSPQLDLARKRRRRLEAMQEAARHPPAQAPFKRESEEARIRGMRDSFRKFGDLFKAAGYERDLARMEGREVEEWAAGDVARPVPPPDAKGPPYVPSPPDPEAYKALLKARIAFFTDMGMVDYVEKMKLELAQIEGQP